MDKINLTLIGGYGGMGRVFTRFFKANGCSVTIAGPTEKKGKAVAEEFGVTYLKDNVKACENADVVVVTVPIRFTNEVIKEVAPHVKPGALLMDLTSVKQEPVELMKKHSQNGVEVVGCHPVFGPRVGGVEGQVFVLTPTEKGRWFDWLKKILEDNKAKIVESTPKEHDHAMAIVQGLTHYTYISLGKTFRELGFNVKESRKFSSPIYDLMLDMIGRIVGQDPSLYAEIQMSNPEIPKIHAEFLKSAKELAETVKEKDEKAFINVMTASAKHFGDTESAMGRSDKAINALVYELKKLNALVGKKVCVKHIYSGVMHYGEVKEVEPENLVIADGGVERKLKLSNIRLTSRSETKEYRREKYGVSARDYSILTPASADAEFISKLIERLFDVFQVEVKDVYAGDKIPEGMQSICLGVTQFRDNLKQSDESLTSFFNKVGWSLR